MKTEKKKDKSFVVKNESINKNKNLEKELYQTNRTRLLNLFQILLHFSF